MTFTVTIEGVILVLLGIIAVAVGIYLLVVLKNANLFYLNINKTLTENQTKIDQILAHLEELSGNTALVSGQLTKQFQKNELIVSSLLQNGADSMLMINDATSKIRTLIATANDIVKLAHRFLKKL